MFDCLLKPWLSAIPSFTRSKFDWCLVWKRSKRNHRSSHVYPRHISQCCKKRKRKKQEDLLPSCFLSPRGTTTCTRNLKQNHEIKHHRRSGEKRKKICRNSQPGSLISTFKRHLTDQWLNCLVQLHAFCASPPAVFFQAFTLKCKVTERG